MRTAAAYLPLAVWAAVVLLIGGLEIHTASLPSGSDKAAHFLMYGAGGALAAWAVRGRGRRAALVAFLAVALTGALDELHQRSVPFRQSDIRDWAADVLGAGTFLFATRRLLGRGQRG